MADDLASILVIDAGVLEHSVVDDEMRRLQTLRIAYEIPDSLILVEHPEIVTRGPRAQRDGVEVESSYQVRDVDRGGDITYHGPGQCVVYPVFGWNLEERSVPKVINLLECWVINALSELGIDGHLDPRMQGVWVDGAKIASIGLSFRHWVSRHGVSINIDTEPGRVEDLQGCGLEAGTTTSLAAIGKNVDRHGAKIDRFRFEEALLECIESSMGRSIGKRIDWTERPGKSE